VVYASKVGDRVYSRHLGWLLIVQIRNDNDWYFVELPAELGDQVQKAQVALSYMELQTREVKRALGD
jgi:hypothetical protein